MLVRQWAKTLGVICGSRRWLISDPLATGTGVCLSLAQPAERGSGANDEKTKSVFALKPRSALALPLKGRLGFRGIRAIFLYYFVCVCVPAFDGARLPFWTLNYLQVFSVPSTGRAREDPTLAMQLLQVWSRETNKNAEDRFLPFLLLKAVRAEESSTVGKSCSPPLSSYCLTFLREGSPYGFLLPLPWGALNQRNSTARGNHSPSPEGWGGVVGVSPMMSFCRSVASV